MKSIVLQHSRSLDAAAARSDGDRHRRLLAGVPALACPERLGVQAHSLCALLKCPLRLLDVLLSRRRRPIGLDGQLSVLVRHSAGRQGGLGS